MSRFGGTLLGIDEELPKAPRFGGVKIETEAPAIQEPAVIDTGGNALARFKPTPVVSPEPIEAQPVAMPAPRFGKSTMALDPTRLEPDDTILGRIKDIGVDIYKGGVGLDQSIAGLAQMLDVTKSVGYMMDAADLAEQSLLGKIPKKRTNYKKGIVKTTLDAIGYNPNRVIDYLNTQYSDERKTEEQKLEAAKGVIDTLKVLATEPAVAIGKAVESAPGMIGIMGAARIAGGRAAVAAEKAAKAKGITDPKIIATLMSSAAKKWATIAASAAEGGQQAGSSFDELIRDGIEDTRSYVASLGSGAITALTSFAMGKAGGKLGLGDVEAGIAGTGGIPARIVKGGIQEGLLEEGIQSPQELAWSNWAREKDITSGLGKAWAIGATTGFISGGVFSMAAQKEAPEPIEGAPPVSKEQAFDSILMANTEEEAVNIIASLTETDQQWVKSQFEAAPEEAPEGSLAVKPESVKEAIERNTGVTEITGELSETEKAEVGKIFEPAIREETQRDLEEAFGPAVPFEEMTPADIEKQMEVPRAEEKTDVKKEVPEKVSPEKEVGEKVSGEVLAKPRFAGTPVSVAPSVPVEELAPAPSPEAVAVAEGGPEEPAITAILQSMERAPKELVAKRLKDYEARMKSRLKGREAIPGADTANEFLSGHDDAKRLMITYDGLMDDTLAMFTFQGGLLAGGTFTARRDKEGTINAENFDKKYRGVIESFKDEILALNSEGEVLTKMERMVYDAEFIKAIEKEVQDVRAGKEEPDKKIRPAAERKRQPDLERDRERAEKPSRVEGVREGVKDGEVSIITAKSLVEARGRVGINSQLDKIFGTHAELDAMEEAGENAKLLDAADKYRADIEYAANERNTEDVEELLASLREELPADRRETFAVSRKADKHSDIQQRPVPRKKAAVTPKPAKKEVPVKKRPAAVKPEKPTPKKTVAVSPFITTTKLTSEDGRAYILEDLAVSVFKAGQTLRQFAFELKKKLGKTFSQIKDKVEFLYKKLNEHLEKITIGAEVGAVGDKEIVDDIALGGTLDKPKKPIEPDEFTEENKRLRDQDKTAWDKAKKFLRRQISPGGLLPKSVFAEKIKRDSEFNVIEFDVKHFIGSLEHAMKVEYGKKFSNLTDTQKKVMTAAIAGNIPDGMRPETKKVLLAMRQYIDKLSTQYVDILKGQLVDLKKEGGKEAQEKARLIEIITGNVGEYIHRSYQAFDDKNWNKKIPQNVIGDARKYLTDRYIESGETEKEARRLAEITLNEIVKTGTAYDNMSTFIRESKLGAKDLSVLQKRKKIAPEIRALLGEYSDPRINFAKSATKMGRLIFNQELLESIRKIGMDNFLFEGKERPAQATKQIAAEGSEVYAPLNGLWTFPEIDQAFKDALGKEQMGPIFRKIVQYNGLIKFGKTVLSPTTAARNWQSAMFFALANGHFDFRHMAKSVSGLREYFTQRGSGAKLDYLRKLKRLGVVYDTPYAGEMMRLLDDSRVEEKLLGSKGVQTFKEGIEFAQKFYQYGDDFWKIIGFENEKAMLIKHAGMSEQEAEIESAERIRNTYPTYSMVGRIVKNLARFPLAGTFVSFPAEILRTGGNMVRYTAKDLKDPKMRPIALRRMAGMAMVAGFAAGLQALSKIWLDIDDDEEQAIRDLAAPWNRNSNIFFTGRDKNGELRFIDLSYLDPYNYFKRPINALIQDRPFEDKLKDVAREMIEPFAGTDIVAGALFEVAANKKRSGGRVFRENDTLDKQAKDIANHLRKAIQPGAAANAERMWKAMRGESSPSGKKYKLKDELYALGGWRSTTIDPKIALYYRSFEFKDGLKDAGGDLYKALRSKNEVPREDILDAYKKAIKLRKNTYDKFRRIVTAGRKSGLSDRDIRTILKNSHVSEKDRNILLRDRKPRWTPSETTRKADIKKAKALFGREVSKVIRQRYKDLARDIRGLGRK